ncbi:MAG: COX15/CtaA family protein [Thermoanaerobaculia bacterium]|nr:COX15/CtaA family protein [Thermoanaerobaculia bacterium]
MTLVRFARLVLGYNLAVILWGAVVRATGSGAGCGSHWPLCDGQVVPRADEVETLIEYSHRVTSGLALLLVLALAIATFRSRPEGDPTRLGAVLSLVLILVEAAVGAGLVLFELVADNASMARALFMAVHLVNTFLLLAALGLTVHWAAGRPALAWRPGGPARRLALLGLGATILIGASGAVAALGDTLFPPETLGGALRDDLSPTAHLLVQLRIWHPLIALLGSGLLWLAAARLPRLAPEPARAARWGRSLLVLVVVQLVVGAVNVALLAPVWLQVVHLLLADLLWLSLVWLAAEALARPGGRPRTA